MRFLCFLIFSLFTQYSLAIHLGKIDQHQVSPVGAIVEIENSDFPYAKALGYYPSIKVKCSLVRIDKNKAITNTHCVYPYIDENGHWKFDEHITAYISFSSNLTKMGHSEDIILHSIKKVVHQVNYNNPTLKKKWSDYMDHNVELTWEEMINYFVPRDVAIIEFATNQKEEEFKLAEVADSSTYGKEVDTFVIGYGPDQYDKLDNNGIRRINSGKIIKSIPEFYDNNLISWFIGIVNQGGLPTDSGGFIGEIHNNQYKLHSMIVVSPYQIDELPNGNTKYSSSIKQFSPYDVKWVNQVINLLDDLDDSGDVQALYHEMIFNGDNYENTKSHSSFI